MRASAPDSLSEEEESDEVVLLGGEDVAGIALSLSFVFFAGVADPCLEELDTKSESESAPELESESALEDEEELAFRFKLLGVPFAAGCFEVDGEFELAPAGSFSSSASLSVLELDVDGEDDLVFDALVPLILELGTPIISFISTSESLSSLLLPLLLVSFFTRTSAAAISAALDLAFAFFLDFLEFLADLVSKLSSVSLLLALLVSSITDLS